MAEEPNEETYEVKDKRRVNPDGTIKEEVTEPKTEESYADIPEGEADIPPPNVYALLQFVTGMLAEQAWQFMGIRLAPGQKEIARDLAQAKIAIDTAAFIADKISPNISEEERKILRDLISSLQINYVTHGQ